VKTALPDPGKLSREVPVGNVKSIGTAKQLRRRTPKRRAGNGGTVDGLIAGGSSMSVFRIKRGSVLEQLFGCAATALSYTVDPLVIFFAQIRKRRVRLACGEFQVIVRGAHLPRVEMSENARYRKTGASWGASENHQAGGHSPDKSPQVPYE
jgi:hypothetical protein